LNKFARTLRPANLGQQANGLSPENVDSGENVDPGNYLGPRIRELRKARDMTLQKIAEASGLSVGYLSQIERNLATPSIKALHDIAQVLGVNISWFFPESDYGTEGERRYIVRAEQRRTLNFGLGIADQLLCPSLSGELELLCSTFEPGALSGEEPYTHRGEEAGIVISGELDLWIGNEKFHLGKGDSFNFPSTTPHRYRNPGESETVVIWAITPPSY
jgi:transcriptional regulator with XRE-family HTH domain